jgi:hypothetical protein
VYRAAIAGEAATAFCLRSAYLRNPQTEAATPGERFRPASHIKSIPQGGKKLREGR